MTQTAVVDDISAANDPPVLGRRARNVAFSLITGGMLLSALDSTIVATALPTIVGDLGGVTETDGRVELSDLGRDRFRTVVLELWRWLTEQVEHDNDDPLDEEGREELRVIARRMILSPDPISEPMELAQAGG